MYIPKKELEKLVDHRNYLIDNNYELSEALKKERSVTKKLYRQLMEKNSLINIKEKAIEEIQLENKELKKQNHIYKEIFNKNKPIWHVNSDNAWRINPNTTKQEQHKIPKNFKENKVYNLELTDDLKWASFKYKDDEIKNTIYKIHRSLAEQLDIVDPIKNTNSQEKINIKKIKDKKYIKKYLESRGINTILEFWNESIDYLVWYRGNTFTTSDFIKECKFGNRETARLYLKQLIDIGLIKRVKKGIYKVLFNFE